MSCVSSISYDNQGNLIAGDGLTISYTSFKQPSQITRGGNRFSFSYGAKLERLKEVRNGTTTYEIDKLYEEESNGEWRIYLQDIAIIKYDATNQHQIRYTHKDRLGSTLTYSDHNGQVTDRRMFDAFGKPRATEGNSLFPARLQSVSLSRNGFTEHRHLDEVELIHMNGRAYDYNLGRFLSVDPIIQSPGNSQSLNPYSYIMNNPLAGTDPTGYVSEEIVIRCGANSPSNCENDIPSGPKSTDGEGKGGSEPSPKKDGNGSGQTQPKRQNPDVQPSDIGSPSTITGGGGRHITPDLPNRHDGLLPNIPSMPSSGPNQKPASSQELFDNVGLASGTIGAIGDLAGIGAASSPYWAANTKTKGLQVYKTSQWGGNGYHNFNKFVSTVQGYTSSVGMTMLGVGTVARVGQHADFLINIRGPSVKDETIDAALDIVIPIAAVAVGTPAAIIAAMAYWGMDTFVYDGNFSKAIRNGQFKRDVIRPFNAIRELF